jgi:hypothetical protein
MYGEPKSGNRRGAATPEKEIEMPCGCSSITTVNIASGVGGPCRFNTFVGDEANIELSWRLYSARKSLFRRSFNPLRAGE